MLNVELKINEELKGIELYFDAKPMEEVRNNLKSNGFRWSGFKKCWYAKQNENTFLLAEELSSGDIKAVEAPKTQTKKVNKKATLTLWDATRWEDVEVNNNQETKQIAKEVRQHLKKRFPQCKISVTSDYSRIYVEIKQWKYHSLFHIRIQICPNSRNFN